MRKLLIPLAVSTALAMWATSAASAASEDHRQDAYYQVHCITDTGGEVLAEAVDAHAIEQGGKGGAIDNFSANYPFGWYCWPEGPIYP
jgi:hypothetical protein